MNTPTTLQRLLLLLLTLSASLSQCSTYQLVESIPLETGLQTNKTTFDAWKEMLTNAQQSVQVVCMYMDLSDGANFAEAGGQQGFEVFNMLNDVFKRGVHLQILAQSPDSFEPNHDLFHFRDIGVDIRFIDWSKIMGGGILHTKIIIVDNKHFYVGSANMDWKSLTQVKEMGIYVRDDVVLASDIGKIFGSYWVAAKNQFIPNQWPKDLYTFYNRTHPVSVDNGNNVYITSSPSPFLIPDRTLDIDALVETIERAKSTISIEVMDYFPGTFYMKPNIYWSTIDDALRNASFVGKKVRFLVSKWPHTKKDAWPFLKSLNELTNIEVKVFEIPEWNPVIPFTRVNHAKFMVTDTHSYIGTSNWSADYFINTAGVSFNWEGEAITNYLQRAFERDWNSKFATTL